MRRRAAITIATAALVALGLGSPAAPHEGGGASRGYSSTITSVTPASAAVELAILEADDRIRLRVDGEHVVEIDGYQGEPYLRFAPDGVERNRRSPATYLNDDRYGKVKLPEEVDPKAPPDWEQVAPGGRAYEWHDHRIHWMSPSYPPKVQAARKQPHHIFDWKVGGTYDGRPLTIRGSLDYAPPPGQSFPVILALPVALILALSGALVLLRRRRRARTPVPG
jgi:hypothetical protein